MLRFHYFIPEFAVRYGLQEAIILTMICYWVEQNEENNVNYHEGRYWTYNSIRAIKELYPYLSLSQIQRAIANLAKKNAIIKGNFNKYSYDKTTWYAITDEVKKIYESSKSAEWENSYFNVIETPIKTGKNPITIIENQNMDLRNAENPSVKNDEPIPLINNIINKKEAAAADINIFNKKESEEDTITNIKIKEKLKHINPVLSTLNNNFLQKVSDAVRSNELDINYLGWLYKEVLRKNPKDMRALYYKLFFEPDLIELYKTEKEIHEIKYPKVECPVCGKIHEEIETICPSCSFERKLYNDKKAIQRQKKYNKFPQIKKDEYDKRREDIFTRGLKNIGKKNFEKEYEDLDKEYNLL